MDLKYVNYEGIKHTIPKVLYKYRTWSNEYHKTILTENKVYLSSPRDFEDNLDCNVPEVFPSREELFSYFLSISKTKNIHYTPQQHQYFAKHWSVNSPLANPKQLEELVKEYNEKFNDVFGVLSTTANSNREEMWEKYADNHKGLCIGFDTDLLSSVVGGGVPCIYVDKLPIVDFIRDNNDEKIIKKIVYKESKWEFEEEYRLTKMWSTKVSNDVRNIKLPQNTIVEVILGKNMTDEHKKEIKEICSTHHPKAKLIER